MTNILVTGGAGYIGSHTCKALARAGYTPVAYDNLVHGHEWAVKWGPLERGDILDTERLKDVLERYSPAAVIHFAAFAYVGESVSNPTKYYRNNVVGTLSLLEAMQAAGTARLVFSSSCATYGIPDAVPISEDAPQRPINPYGASKLMCERMIADQCSALGLTAIALRYFNAAGADPEGELGELHEPETHLVPLVLGAAAGQSDHVTVFGEDYDTPDGTCIRDYIHVTDLAAAHVAALTAVTTSTGWQPLNLGSGRGTSVAELIAAAERVTGRKVPVQMGSRRVGDAAALVADATNASDRLGWRAQHSDINSILESAWAWMMRSRSATSATSVAALP